MQTFMGYKDSSASVVLTNLGLKDVRSKGQKTDNTIYHRKEFEKAFKTKMELVSE